MTDSCEKFLGELQTKCSELGKMLREHTEYNSEILPHVFMGDVTRFVVLKVRSGEVFSIMELLGALEDALAFGDEKLQELVVVSFVENLIGEDKSIIAELKNRMGPGLKKEVEQICEQ